MAGEPDPMKLGRIVALIALGLGACSNPGRREGPIIDTTAGGSLQMLQRVDFATDSDHPDEKFDRRSRVVVYWRRPVVGDDPHVVGVQVGEDNVARIFFAIILPPE